MSSVAVHKTQRRLSYTDVYGGMLLGLLAAYAISGKGFAYVGVAPLYVSEIMLGLGFLTLFWTRALLVIQTIPPAALLSLLLMLVVARTIPYLPIYGMDAARDSVIVVYCLYAFVVAGLILEQPSRITQVVKFLRGLTGIYVYVGPVAYLVNQIGFLAVLPNMPGTLVPIVFLRPGELGVHLSACAVLAIVRLRRISIIWVIALCLGAGIVASQNRGGFLAFLIPVAIALMLTGRWRAVVMPLIIGGLALGLACALDLNVPTDRDDGRSIGARQIVENLASIAMTSGNSEQDDTKRWRQDWWTFIVNYTFHGQYFWTGKGFGLNLSVADGFELSSDLPGALRSPHNSHLNILARTGVPGIVLWGAFSFSWMWMVLACARRAWSSKDESWGNLLLFIACYWLSIMIDATFDVVLEGPMLGIWFWCLTGFGLAVVMTYQSAVRRNTRNSLRLSAEFFRQKRMSRRLNESS